MSAAAFGQESLAAIGQKHSGARAPDSERHSRRFFLGVFREQSSLESSSSPPKGVVGGRGRRAGFQFWAGTGWLPARRARAARLGKNHVGQLPRRGPAEPPARVRLRLIQDVRLAARDKQTRTTMTRRALHLRAAVAGARAGPAPRVGGKKPRAHQEEEEGQGRRRRRREGAGPRASQRKAAPRLRLRRRRGLHPDGGAESGAGRDGRRGAARAARARGVARPLAARARRASASRRKERR